MAVGGFVLEAEVGPELVGEVCGGLWVGVLHGRFITCLRYVVLDDRSEDSWELGLGTVWGCCGEVTFKATMKRFCVGRLSKWV